MGVIYEPAADTAKAFESMLAEKGLGYYIVSAWAGWRRHGVIRVVPVDAQGEADWTKPPILCEEFVRSTYRGGSLTGLLGVCAPIARNTRRCSTLFSG